MERRNLSLLAAVVASFFALALAAPGAEAAPCGTPGNNEVIEENCLPGSPASEWDVSGAGSTNIQGFATNISVAQGQTVQFKVDTNSTNYKLDIYRMGYYDGDGARRVATVQPSAALPQNQPACNGQDSTGLLDCGNWAVSASWAVPANATSGIYFAKLEREDGTAGASHVMFVVRDDDGLSDLLFQTSDTTWQAYNTYGGNSFYQGSPDGRAYKLSYNRPFITRGNAPEDWVFNAEYPMVRWIEANGYDVSYSTGVDSDRLPAELLDHKLFLSVGHDEYWSGTQRGNVEAARAAGVNLAFFSGNEVFWKTRWENDHRTLVTYKETHANDKIDPEGNVWTGTWRDPRSFNPQGGRPENALTGTVFTVNAGTEALRVPADDGKLRLWRGTDVANQLPGGTKVLTDGTVGYEWDEDLDNGARPDGLVRLSSTTVSGVDKLQDYGSTYASGTATHHLTLYRETNGAGKDALVFGAGTVQWSWGLDARHDRGSAPADESMQQATVNLFADMGSQPGTLQSGLSAAGASTDAAPPTSAIGFPAVGATLDQRAPVTITGTASEAQGRVGGVEVSVDDGATWHPATGRETWSYTWTPDRSGPVTLRSRAVDDSANLSGSSAPVTVTVSGRTCPCSMFGAMTPATTANNDGDAPIEAGVRFRSDQDGVITALRYYKGAGWTGIRTGHLWSANGTRLAEVAFSGESASGWQQAELNPPVAVTKNTEYVASYLSSTGYYAADLDFFGTEHVAAPLRALTGGNGVFAYGGGFPTVPFRDSNYWADVVFAPADAHPPQITALDPADGSAGVATGTAVRATFSEPLDAATVTAGTFQLRSAAGALVPAGVGYQPATRTATLTPGAALAAGSLYTATLTTGVEDAAGNPLAQARSWSFTTAGGTAPDPGKPPGSEPYDKPPGTGPGDSGNPPGSSSADRTGPRVKLALRGARVSRRGAAKLRVTCPRGEQRCEVALTIQYAGRAGAKRKLTVLGGSAQTVRVKLSRAARRALARKGTLRVTAVAVVRDAAGNRATTRTTIQLTAGRAEG